MEQQTAVVTGSGTGIGSAISKKLGLAGFRVGIHYNKSKEPALLLQKEIPKSFLLSGDLSTIEGCDSVFNQIKEAANGQTDVFVNNAGMTFDNPIFSSTLEEFSTVVNVNMRAVWYMTKKISRLMIRKKAGRIINISSVVAHIGNPTQAVYSMTKAAVESFTRVAAAEFSPYNILVNAVAPGFISTEMTKKMPPELKERITQNIVLGRIGEPEEVAQAVEFLAKSGSYITGSVLHVNGGLYGG